MQVFYCFFYFIFSKTKGQTEQNVFASPSPGFGTNVQCCLSHQYKSCCYVAKLAVQKRVGPIVSHFAPPFLNLGLGSFTHGYTI